MTVERLDHVNIVTDRLEETAKFYADLLGLERIDAPAPMTRQTAAWMCDERGIAIIHLNSLDCPRSVEASVELKAGTGPLHHVALRCSGYDEVRARLDGMAASYRAGEVKPNGLRQIFTPDPNGVLLELNFFEG